MYLLSFKKMWSFYESFEPRRAAWWPSRPVVEIYYLAPGPISFLCQHYVIKMFLKLLANRLHECLEDMYISKTRILHITKIEGIESWKRKKQKLFLGTAFSISVGTDTSAVSGASIIRIIIIESLDLLYFRIINMIYCITMIS